jgi:hypothetical protein
MSVDAVVARVAELQQLIGGGQPVPPPAAPASSFSAQLATASAAVGAPTATAAASFPATGASELPAGTPFGSEITAAAKRHGVDPALLAGLVK